MEQYDIDRMGKAIAEGARQQDTSARAEQLKWFRLGWQARCEVRGQHMNEQEVREAFEKVRG